MEEHGSSAHESGEASTELSISVPGQHEGSSKNLSDRSVCGGKKTRNDYGGVIDMEFFSGDDSITTAVKTPLSLKDWMARVKEMDCSLLVV
ncbi:hypothetical protein C2845_PM15G09180 [Panicum miliaceum]|uniref:Uncharacterized protein n=1 Tax=Panicum miliaceum TaxID=4540 RepID=A0A3L6Q7G8_PANMI|nr:hypothetical protein C2845_PM15G09180 [Panicum miliaceum]